MITKVCFLEWMCAVPVSFCVLCIGPPSSPADFLLRLYDHLLRFQNNNGILSGDFNLFLEYIHWKCYNNLWHNVCMWYITNCNRVYTCPGLNSLLDLIFVTNVFSDCHVSVEDGVSDHKLLYFCCSLVALPANKRPTVTTVKDFSHSVLQYLDSAIADFQINDSDVSVLWQRFKLMCSFCLDNFIPNKQWSPKLTNP